MTEPKSMPLDQALDAVPPFFGLTPGEQIAVVYTLRRAVQQQARELAGARALHVPDDTLDCRACNAHVTTGEPVKWPCPTATALGTPRLVMTVQWEPA